MGHFTTEYFVSFNNNNINATESDVRTLIFTDPRKESLLPGFRKTSDMGCVHSGLPYRYTPPAESGLSQVGELFNVSITTVKAMGLPPKRYFSLTLDTVKNFQFVTAADHSHYEESMDAVASIQANFPDYIIHYYNIGLKEEEVNDVKTWCNVKIHNFPFEEYPPHIHQLQTKCFKYLVIQRALREHGAMFWVDASFRAEHNISGWSDMFEAVVKNGGIIFAENFRAYRNLDWTGTAMYKFIVTNTTVQRWVIHYESGAVLIFNTEWAFTRVLWWMYLCSLDVRCCTEPHYRDSVNVTNRFGKIITPKHRFDQSSLNLLLSNAHGYNDTLYVSPVSHLFFRRRTTRFYTLRRCRPKWW